MAVLCLAYFPYISSIMLNSTTEWDSIQRPFVDDMLNWIIDAVRVSVPLLMILALTKDPWARFGIVRPKWIVDALLSCAIGVCAFVFLCFVMSILPSSMREHSTATHAVSRTSPEGPLGYILLFVACIVGAFAEELVMRGYLIARLERLLTSTVAAVAIATMVFASYHLYQGLWGVIGAGANGLVYAVAFCLLRRLWPICLAHAFYNFVLYL